MHAIQVLSFAFISSTVIKDRSINDVPSSNFTKFF